MQDFTAPALPDWRGALDRLTEELLRASQRAESIDAAALTFLLRQYAATDRRDLGDALGVSLARALDGRPTDAEPRERAEWLALFAEAAGLSDDERVHATAIDLIAAVRADWGRAESVDTATRSVDVCLAAAHLGDPHEIVPSAIDELERVVGAAYRPGAGIAHTVGAPGGAPAYLADHVRAASALLTAHDITGRLPYSMLAEELMQFARRTMWRDRDDGFSERPDAPGMLDDAATPFALNCEAARVLCRLAALHGDGGYRRAAVLASDADYDRDAARILAAREPASRQHGARAAVYGLALTEWLGRHP